MPLLVMKNVQKKFNNATVLTGITLSVNAGETLAIIGSAGSGKTTLLDLISGLTKPSEGRILFRGENLGARPLSQYASIGIARTFSSPRLLEDLTVWENILIGTHSRGSWNMTGALHGLFAPCVRKEEKLLKDLAMDCLKKVELTSRYHQLARSLTPYEQKRLELARAMAAQPVLLLLDEPLAGLSDTEKEFLRSLMKDMHRSGTTIILSQEDKSFTGDISTISVLLENGRVTPIKLTQ